VGDRSRLPVVLPAIAALGVGAGLVFAAAGTDADGPATVTTTTSTTIAAAATPDPVDLLAVALARRLAGDANVDTTAGEVRCLAEEAAALLGERRLIELADEPSDPEEAFTGEERAALVRALVACLGPDAASAVLGAGTDTEAPVGGFPDDGIEDDQPAR
jgi:hypothetical protein